MKKTKADFHKDYEKSAIKKMSAASILGNFILTVFKLFAGFSGNSSSMVSDAIHSLSDLLTTVIAFFGVKLSKKENDLKHPYGYERFESVALIFLGAILLITGFEISKTAVLSLLINSCETIKKPGLIALIAAGISIIVKEAMYHYTKYYAKKINSSAFLADAWHHRSDALSSVASFIGIIGAMLGFPKADFVACLTVSVFIIKIGFDFLVIALRDMIDSSLENRYQEKIKEIISKNANIEEIISFRTRKFGNKGYVDLKIAISSTFSFKDVYNITEKIKKEIKEEVSIIKGITVETVPH